MGGYRDSRSVRIKCFPQDCFDALTDFERLPEWQNAVRAARVIERDAHERGAVVEYEVDTGVRRVRYTLRQEYEEPYRLGSRYVSGDFRAFEGEWRFTPERNGYTRAELEVSIDPGRLVPRPVRALISRVVVQRALDDLKTHIEGD
jgi:ribosome-associated toxin RatA of RatAB toxin-antitoxin module